MCIKGGMTAILTSLLRYHTSQNRCHAIVVHDLFQPAAAGGKFLFARSRQRSDLKSATLHKIYMHDEMRFQCIRSKKIFQSN